MEALRTPDERFEDIPDFPWSPHYADDLPGYEGLRVAWLDEGPADGPVFLCLHGEPSWSFLYRKMLPVFLAAGGRVIAPDFLGFGRSDKPVDDAAYTWDFHRNLLLALIDRLDLSQVTLVCQDWGGLLGLTLPLDLPDLVARVIVMNTAIGTGRSAGEGFEQWKAFVANTPDFDVGGLMRRSVPGLTDAEADAYDAPFPDARYKAGVRTFPSLVPVAPDMDGAELGRRAVTWWSEEFSGQSFLAVGLLDPVLGLRAMQRMQKVITGAPELMVLEGAGHFVQEAGEAVAIAALEAFGGA